MLNMAPGGHFIEAVWDHFLLPGDVAGSLRPYFFCKNILANFVRTISDILLLIWEKFLELEQRVSHIFEMNLPHKSPLPPKKNKNKKLT